MLKNRKLAHMHPLFPHPHILYLPNAMKYFVLASYLQRRRLALNLCLLPRGSSVVHKRGALLIQLKSALLCAQGSGKGQGRPRTALNQFTSHTRLHAHPYFYESRLLFYSNEMPLIGSTFPRHRLGLRLRSWDETTLTEFTSKPLVSKPSVFVKTNSKYGKYRRSATKTQFQRKRVLTRRKRAIKRNLRGLHAVSASLQSMLLMHKRGRSSRRMIRTRRPSGRRPFVR